MTSSALPLAIIAPPTQSSAPPSGYRQTHGRTDRTSRSADPAEFTCREKETERVNTNRKCLPRETLWKNTTGECLWIHRSLISQHALLTELRWLFSQASVIPAFFLSLTHTHARTHTLPPHFHIIKHAAGTCSLYYSCAPPLTRSECEKLPPSSDRPRLKRPREDRR